MTTPATVVRRASPAEVTAAVDAVQEWINRRQRTMLAHLHQCSQSP